MKSIENILQTLIINGTLTEPPGLFNGKTGMAVFFFHYARLSGKEMFEEYALDLIEEVRKQITIMVPPRYDTGLAGIGVGFEYILQNNFMEADDDEIFEDFDARMYRNAMYEPYFDLSLERGLTGWGRYFIYRLRRNRKKQNKLHEALTHIANEITNKIAENTIPENEQPDVYRFFHDLTTLPIFSKKFLNSLQQCRKWKCISEPDVQKLFPYMEHLQRLYTFQNYFNMDLNEKIAQEWKNWEELKNNSLTDIGLLKGWTAEGLLHLIYSHNHDVSWISLL